MENQTDSKGIIIQYGLFYGAGLILFSLITYAMGKHLDGGYDSILITAAVIITCIVLGIKKFKKENNDFLYFGQAIKIGVGIAILGTLLSIVYNQVFINFIEPDFMEQVYLKAEQTLLDAGFSDEQIESNIAMQKKMSNPLISSAMGILFFAFIGFVISAITGAIMQRREEDTF